MRMYPGACDMNSATINLLRCEAISILTSMTRSAWPAALLATAAHRLVQPAARRRVAADHRRRSDEAALDQRRAHLAGRRPRRLRRVDAVASQKRTRGRAVCRACDRRRAGAAGRIGPHLQHADAAAAASLVARRLDPFRVLAFEGPRPQVFGVPVARRRAAGADQGAGGRLRVRVVARRQEPRLHHARSDAAPTRSGSGRSDRSSSAPTRPTLRRGWLCRRLDGSAPRALTPPSQYVDALVVVARRPRDRVLRRAAHRIHRRLRSPRLRRRRSTAAPRGPIVDRPGMNTGPRYSPDGRQIAFISTNGQHRRHGVAQPDRRRGGRRHRRARSCSTMRGSTSTCGRPTAARSTCGRTTARSDAASTCSSSRSCD